jgi:hypothetical protein
MILQQAHVDLRKAINLSESWLHSTGKISDSSVVAFFVALCQQPRIPQPDVSPDRLGLFVSNGPGLSGVLSELWRRSIKKFLDVCGKAFQFLTVFILIVPRFKR